MLSNELFDARQQESADRLRGVRSELSRLIDQVDGNTTPPKVCIYATGSLARLEATIHSDLDAFFFLSGGNSESPFSRIRDVKILNAVIVASERHSFPDFSNDGEYLKFLHINEVLNHIGGREDDYHNAFTARMLLILESAYLYDDTVYRELKVSVIERYFQDFHKHSKDFRPLFLLNDILRFWRTLCLNYEHSRHWRVEDEERRAKGHLANLKLRFSRLNICFSFIASLLSRGGALSPESVLDVSELTPISRLQSLAEVGSVKGQVTILLEEYAWFLEVTGKSKSDVLGWISQEDYRNEAFDHSDKFIEAMYQTVRTIADEHGYLRYLVI